MRVRAVMVAVVAVAAFATVSPATAADTGAGVYVEATNTASGIATRGANLGFTMQNLSNRPHSFTIRNVTRSAAGFGRATFTAAEVQTWQPTFEPVYVDDSSTESGFVAVIG